MAGRKERERVFVENGSKLLEKMIGTCNGKSTPIRNFSYQELKRATNNFHDSLIISSDVWGWYKGSHEGRNVLIKTLGKHDYYGSDEVINDIAISAMMSAHNNVLRLIGCCLETQPPSIVFEFPGNDTLDNRIHNVSNRSRTDQRQYEAEPMAWSSRLRVAREIAHAISYLHTAFSRPIIHRDINMENIFLDQQDDVAKLSNFGRSISIPKGETHIMVKSICGIYEYMCPEYAMTGMVTEKTDVFSFGMVLFELLTGQKPGICYIDEDTRLEDYIKIKHAQGGCINEIADPAILQGEGRSSIEHQLKVVLDLVVTCIEKDPVMRPTMVDITKQLRQIERSIP